MYSTQIIYSMWCFYWLTLQDQNAISCLPESFTQEELEQTKRFLTTLYSISIALFFVELSSFVSGCSMFNINQSLVC